MGTPSKSDRPKPDEPSSKPGPDSRPAVAAQSHVKRQINWQVVGQTTWRWTKRLALGTFVLLVIAALGVVLLIRHYESDLPSVGEVQGNYHPPQVTRVLARDGTLLAELFTQRRTVVSIDKLPAHVKLAILAAEDAHFYEHEGLNYLGMVRALVVNLRSGRTRQGASTITQQVVKNILLDPERTYRRKMREVILAKRLEQNLSKDKILELYLNHIYFGHGRYGIEEASRNYFGCSATELTLDQAAMLAGVVASPEGYSPRNNPERATERRRFVLEQMRQKGFIKDEQFSAAIKTPIVLTSPASAKPELAPEVVEIVKKTLRKVAGEGALLGGFTVTTTIDPKLQAAARKSVQENLNAFDKRHGRLAPFKRSKSSKRKKPFEGTPRFSNHQILLGEVTGADDEAGLLYVRVGAVKGAVHLEDHLRYNPKALPPSEFAETGSLVRVSLLAPEPDNPSSPNAPPVPLRLELGPQSALVAIDVRSREVLALVGNFEGAPAGLDRATQARRQPGSTFKPVVYSYALHTRRFTPATLVETRPQSVHGYKPMNFEESQGKEPTRMREAVANSINVAAAHVAREVGVANVVSWARALGVTSKLGADLSLALGSYEVAPVEMANTYATFASGGIHDTPRFILRIVDGAGKEVPIPSPPPSRRVMDEGEAFITTSILQSVIDHGTGKKAKALRRPLAGKTGTSNQAKDAWFVGYSTDIACAVWTGFDDAVPLGRREAGSTAALPAWVTFMRAAHEGRPPTNFPRPADVSVARIDPVTGLLAREDQEDALEEFFLRGTEPTEIAIADAGDAEGDAAADGGMADALTIPPMDHDAATLPALPPPDNPVPLF